MKITVAGAGAWGTALAINASANAAGHQVTLWARDPDRAEAMQRQRVNQRYLPQQPFPGSLALAAPGWSMDGCSASGLGQHAAGQDLLVIATPMAGLRAMLAELAQSAVPVAWLCKGFEAPRGDASGLLAHEVRSQVAPDLAGAVLSGPSFALEVARGLPSALVAASEHVALRETLVAAFHGPTLRIYGSDDVTGVEVGGAVKNVLAIAAGLCDGMGLGLNARAALITRGLAEMTRLGSALGARAETFMGLSGLGDLVLTTTGDLSRNRQVGLALARGLTLEQAVDALGHVAEGVYCARTVLQRAHALDVEMPITQAVVALLDGRLSPLDAVSDLMGRGPRSE